MLFTEFQELFLCDM